MVQVPRSRTKVEARTVKAHVKQNQNGEGIYRVRNWLVKRIPFKKIHSTIHEGASLYCVSEEIYKLIPAMRVAQGDRRMQVRMQTFLLRCWDGTVEK